MTSTYLNIGKVLLIVLGIHVSFSAINVLQNISNTVIKGAGFGKLGFYENGILSLSLALTCVKITSQIN